MSKILVIASNYDANHSYAGELQLYLLIVPFSNLTVKVIGIKS